MITLKDWMETVEYRITEGCNYTWDCYGPDAYQLSAWNGVHGDGGWSLNIVFDTVTQEVYEVDVCDYTNDRAYRIINPEYREDYREEEKNRGEFASQAWDDVNYSDLETDDDWMQKAQAIVNNIDYDTRVSIPLDIPDAELLTYMKMAHERDMTFNQFVEEALQAAINEYEVDPEGLKSRFKTKSSI